MTEWCFVRSTDLDTDQAWEPIRALLHRLCAEYRAEDVRASVRDGHFQMFVARDDAGILAVLLTQIARRRDDLVCNVIWCGGDHMGEWVDHSGLLERWAKDHGCSAIRGEGRIGWVHYYTNARRTGQIWESPI